MKLTKKSLQTFHLQIPAAFVLFWGLTNLFDGFITNNWLNLIKGVAGTVTGAYLMYFSDKIMIFSNEK